MPAESRTHRVAGTTTSILDIGARLKLGEAVNLLASAGHGVGPDSPDRPDWVFYLALQLLR